MPPNRNDILRLPVPDLGKPEAPPQPALEMVCHETTVSLGQIGNTDCLVFDLLAPGMAAPMLIRITVPIHDPVALEKIEFGIHEVLKARRGMANGSQDLDDA